MWMLKPFYYSRQLYRRLLAGYATYHLRSFQALKNTDVKILNGFTRITAPAKCVIHSGVRIMDGGYFQTEGSLYIGSGSIISRGVTILTQNHDYREGYPFGEGVRNKAVTIGNQVWIGMNVTLLPGTNIGNGSIVQAGSVISGQFPPEVRIANDHTFYSLKQIERFKNANPSRNYMGQLDLETVEEGLNSLKATSSSKNKNAQKL